MEMISFYMLLAMVSVISAWVSAHAVIRIETGLSFAENAKQPASLYRYYDGDLQCYVTSEKHKDAHNTALGCGLTFGMITAIAVYAGGALGFAAVALAHVVLVAAATRKVRMATANI